MFNNRLLIKCVSYVVRIIFGRVDRYFMRENCECLTASSRVSKSVIHSLFVSLSLTHKNRCNCHEDSNEEKARECLSWCVFLDAESCNRCRSTMTCVMTYFESLNWRLFIHVTFAECVCERQTHCKLLILKTRRGKRRVEKSRRTFCLFDLSLFFLLYYTRSCFCLPDVVVYGLSIKLYATPQKEERISDKKVWWWFGFSLFWLNFCQVKECVSCLSKVLKIEACLFARQSRWEDWKSAMHPSKWVITPLGRCPDDSSRRKRNGMKWLKWL